MLIPGTTKEVIQALQKEGISIPFMAKLMGISAKCIYEALRGNTTGETALLFIQLYIKFKLDTLKIQKKSSPEIEVIARRGRKKQSAKKNKLIQDVVDMAVRMRRQTLQFKYRFSH